METPTVRIPLEVVQDLITGMQRSEGYCSKARPFTLSKDDANSECTDFYSGASGYAGATLRSAIQTLETYTLL